MPVMEPNLDAATLKAWARVIDGGPFSSLCWGERIAFDNPDSLTLLGALAAWTDRVRLVTTVIVPQLHDPVMLAKGLATGDMLSGGRLTVGLGVGANGLVGGSFNSIVLQPISIETNQGLNVAAGIASLTLEPAPELAGPAR